MADTTEIPAYTKWGARLTTLVMLLLAFFLLKNCAVSLVYGPATEEAALEQYRQMGRQAGERQAAGEPPAAEPEVANPLLRKAYQGGFREGYDAARGH
ncbi:MAG: hypothetical protein AB1634_16485 [Thermodesulfobacteriota bacterium]